jgi:hypothetical protein
MDFFEGLRTAVVLALSIILIVGILVFAEYKYTVEIAEANIVTVYSKGQVVYTGKKAFVNIESGGMVTTVTIYKRLFPFAVIDKIYSNKEIAVTN